MSAPEPLTPAGQRMIFTCNKCGWSIETPSAPQALAAGVEHGREAHPDERVTGQASAEPLTPADVTLTDAEQEQVWQGLRRARHDDAPVSLLSEGERPHFLWAVTPAIKAIVAAREAAARAAERERLTAARDACRTEDERLKKRAARTQNRESKMLFGRERLGWFGAAGLLDDLLRTLNSQPEATSDCPAHNDIDGKCIYCGEATS